MNKKYLKERKVIIRKDIHSLLSEIDTLVFDIDGVLVDVNASFLQTIIDTVQYYFNRIVKLPRDALLMERKSIECFKMVGGFNDDWELAAAAILVYLWKMKEYEIKSLEELKIIFPLFPDFINKNLSGGGGLVQVIHWVKENSVYTDELFSLWKKEEIFQIAKEFYAGEKYCYRLYGFHPRLTGRVNGNLERESIIIIPEMSETVKKYHVGILTGRNRAETKFIMDQLGWNSWLYPKAVITSEDHMTKPAPDGLKSLLEQCRSKMALFIGDTMDDLLTVKNLNRQSEKQRCLSGLVFGIDFSDQEGKRAYYKEYDVDLLAEDVNQMVRLIEDQFR